MAYRSDCSSISYSDFSRSETSFVSTSFEIPSYGRRMFEALPDVSQTSEARLTPSKMKFKHLTLELRDGNKKKVKNFERKSFSSREIRKKNTDRTAEKTKLHSSTSNLPLSTTSTQEFSILIEKPPFSESQLLQPITPRNTSQKPKSKKKGGSLDHFDLIETAKEVQFNKKFCDKLKKKIETTRKFNTTISKAKELDELANQLFEIAVKEKTKGYFLDLKKVNYIDLSLSEQDRAQLALFEVLKEARLIKQILSRLKYLKISIYDCLENKIDTKEKKQSKNQNFKSKWCDLFFSQLENLIASCKTAEMNPLKSFTYRYENEFTDKKMQKFVLLALKIDQKEFDTILKVLNKWSNFTQLTDLKEKVGEIDRLLIKEEIDNDCQFIGKQKHQWFESLKSNHSFSQIQIGDILHFLKPKKNLHLTVNKKPISYEESDNGKISQTNFLFSLMKKIYQQGFDPILKDEAIREQAILLVDLEELAAEIKKDLNNENSMSWSSIQKKLSSYRAVPFMKLKNIYDRDLHLDSLSHLIGELSIPCLDVLKLCTNKSWKKAHSCIFALFTPLFKQQGDVEEKNLFKTHLNNEIRCDITINSNKSYYITQIKSYETYPLPSISSSLGLPKLDKSLADSSSISQSSIIGAKITFKWTLCPFFHKETREWCWKGLLEIPDVETHPLLSSENKINILKILQHPNIIDFVENEIKGDPKIISTFST